MDYKNLELMLDKELEDKILEEAIMEEVNKQNKTLNKTTVKSKKKKRKLRGKRIRDGIKIRMILLLIVTLIANTYAWFVYITAAFSSIDMHIRGWNIAFVSGDQEEDFVFTVDALYPGMDEVTERITVSNNGENPAEILTEVSSYTIMGEEYKADSVAPDGETYTSTQLLNKLLNDYPFIVKIQINGQDYDVDGEYKLEVGETEEVQLLISWPFETGETKQQIETNDAIDTEWGERAYEWYQNNPDATKIIEVKTHISASQIIEETTPDEENPESGENSGSSE